MDEIHELGTPHVTGEPAWIANLSRPIVHPWIVGDARTREEAWINHCARPVRYAWIVRCAPPIYL